MSTPEQPETPQLTRRQLREIRNTGATPVVTPEDLEKAAAEAADTEIAEEPGGDQTEPATPPAPAPPAPAAAPLARAAEPVTVAEPPVADASVDLGVSPLTRRQARQQERIRTASVPVITPDVAAAHTQAADVQAPDVQDEAPEQDAAAPAETPSWWTDVAAEGEAEPQDAGETDDEAGAAAEPRPAAAAVEPDLLAEVDADEPADAHELFAPLVAASDEIQAEGDIDAESDSAQDEVAEAEERPILNPRFGADLLAGESQTDALPPSFDQLITRSTTGSVATSNALIMPHSSGPSPIVAPVTATGEVLITGTFNLPEGLGSIGHVPGAADGKEVDASLIDGEIPAHSSPTPIAASAAISTVKTTGEVIRPPAPEKGSKLMISLAITAGVLALALVGVLIVAIVTGVFQ